MENSIAEAILIRIEELLLKKSFLLVAIDGRCGSGKTTLAEAINELRGYPIVYMDHFYPRLKQRTEERLNEPGGNLDRERFLKEVMAPLLRQEPFSYRPYNPMVHDFSPPISITPVDVVIIEGSYSLHPELISNYDLRIFMTVDMEERIRRIRERNGEAGLEMFIEKWIPMEEHYFKTFKTEDQCDFVFDTG